MTGCLADSYAIRRDELVRIASLPPENRGTHVRATQQTIFADSYAEPDPPEAEPEPGPGPSVVVDVPIPLVAIDVHHHAMASIAANSMAKVQPSRRQAAHPGPARSSSKGIARHGLSGSGGGSGGGGKADAAVVVAVAAAVLATAAISVVAATEVPRFDGWMWLPRQELVLIEPKVGAPYWVPLSDMTLQEVELAERGVVRPPAPILLERAPLDRVGAATSLELGGSGMRSSTHRGIAGFVARYAVGGFPRQWLGLLGNAGFSAGDDRGTVFEGRLGMEMRLIPMRLGIAHFGAYGEFGHAWLLHDVLNRTAHGRGAYYGFGALFEADITTRFGLLARGGVAWLPEFDRQNTTGVDRLPFPEFSLGFTVY